MTKSIAELTDDELRDIASYDDGSPSGAHGFAAEVLRLRGETLPLIDAQAEMQAIARDIDAANERLDDTRKYADAAHARAKNAEAELADHDECAWSRKAWDALAREADVRAELAHATPLIEAALALCDQWGQPEAHLRMQEMRTEADAFRETNARRRQRKRGGS